MTLDLTSLFSHDVVNLVVLCPTRQSL